MRESTEQFKGASSKRFSRHRKPLSLPAIVSGSGLCLVGVFFVNILFDSLPIRLNNPEWMLQICVSLITSANILLVGMILIVAPSSLGRDPGTSKDAEYIQQRSNFARNACVWISRFFVLVIILQALSAYRTLNAWKARSMQPLNQLESALVAIEKSQTRAELQTAVNMLPGNPPSLPSNSDRPILQFRDQLLDQVRPQVMKAKNDLEIASNKRGNQGFQSLLKLSLISSIYIYAFHLFKIKNESKSTSNSHLFNFPILNRFLRRKKSTKSSKNFRKPQSSISH